VGVPSPLYLALPNGRASLTVRAPLLLSRFDSNCASVPLPRAAFSYSSHRGGVRPGGGFLSSPSFGGPGNLIEPPSSRTTPPTADIQSRTAKDKRLLAIFVAGRRTLEALPPAMWFRATSKKTIRPSDQSSSISTILRHRSLRCHDKHVAKQRQTGADMLPK